MGVPKSFPQDKIHIENCTQFCNDVEKLVEDSHRQAEIAFQKGYNRPRMSYIQAVLSVAEGRGIEEALAAAYLSPDIKDKIRIEAENLNMINKSAALPF
jgi:Phage late-transcription coactivator